MSTIRIGAGLAALVVGTQLLAAQQPGQPPPGDSGRRGMMGGPENAQQEMRMVDSLNARLDTLVRRMNRVTGNQKVAAMADVINEMVAQRKVMQEHMRRMMESRRGKMDMMGKRPPAANAPPQSTADSVTADSSGHQEHHQQE